LQFIGEQREKARLLRKAGIEKVKNIMDADKDRF
jgi:hypothetical protein